MSPSSSLVMVFFKKKQLLPQASTCTVKPNLLPVKMRIFPFLQLS